MSDRKSVLFINIGTGSIIDKDINGTTDDEKKAYLDNLLNSTDENDKTKKDKVNSYIETLCIAVNKAAAQNVVLVHSNVFRSRFYTEKIKNFCEQQKYNVESTEIDAFNVERCCRTLYDIFNKYKAKSKIVNFTHGTKIMGAALFHVGLHYADTKFQYIIGQGNDGEREFNSDSVYSFEANEAQWQAVRQQCRGLFADGHYAAVTKLLLSITIPENQKSDAEQYLNLADFCTAWDRFDYKNAKQKFKNCIKDIPDICYRTREGCAEFLQILSEPMKGPEKDKLSAEEIKYNIKKGIYLLFDIYANYARRMRAKLYEDAGIRIYRMAELLGQICLFERGYYASSIPVNDIEVTAFLRTNPNYQPENFRGRQSLSFARKEVLGFLDFLNRGNREHLDRMGYLNRIEETVEQRNNSILIHGYSTFSEDVAKTFEDTVKVILELARKLIDKYHLGNYDTIRETAMFLNNNFK